MKSERYTTSSEYPISFQPSEGLSPSEVSTALVCGLQLEDDDQVGIYCVGCVFGAKYGVVCIQGSSVKVLARMYSW